MSGCGFITCYDTVGKEECCDVWSHAAEGITQECYDTTQHDGHSDADSVDHHCSNRSCQNKETTLLTKSNPEFHRMIQTNQFCTSDQVRRLLNLPQIRRQKSEFKTKKKAENQVKIRRSLNLVWIEKISTHGASSIFRG